MLISDYQLLLLIYFVVPFVYFTSFDLAYGCLLPAVGNVTKALPRWKASPGVAQTGRHLLVCTLDSFNNVMDSWYFIGKSCGDFRSGIDTAGYIGSPASIPCMGVASSVLTFWGRSRVQI